MRSQTVGSGSSGVAAVGSSGRASCFSSPPEPGTVCERGTRPSCQSSWRRWQLEAVAGAGNDQRLEAVRGELRTLGQVADAGERFPLFSLGDDSSGIFCTDSIHVVDADADCTIFERALGGADVHVRRACLDSAPLAVADERRGWVEAHRLSVQERAQELRRVVVSQPRRLVREQTERSGM